MQEKKTGGLPDQNQLLQLLARKTGRDPAQMQQLFQGNTAGLLEGMNPEARATAEKVLADPALAAQLLQSPQVRELLQRLMGGGK
ncbi:MAG: hypothetical protein PUC47_10830 [Oscillospiraceae bacterium]|nr:hypothetical protein [Oscillospiraceae bacterium]